MEKILKETYTGELNLNGVKISCSVLEDGTRVLVNRSLATALGIKGGGAYWQKKKNNSDSPLLPEYLSANYLAPFISDELMIKLTSPISYVTLNNQSREGVSAELLSDILNVYIKAGKENALPDNQRLADISYKILLSFSKVGIIALVDEATGYQYDREKDELQKIIKAYISEELLPWQKRFPDVFYRELFRLNGWDFTIRDIRKRPGIIGTWTNKIIYEQLPKGVLDGLKNKTPKNESGNYVARFHQSLTTDIGEPNLEKQINKVITLFQVSDNMAQFWANFRKMIDRQNGQLQIPFEFDDEGHTKEE